MKFETKKMLTARLAGRTATVATLAAALFSSAAVAQVEDEAIEEVIVTGSRIKNANISAPSPVTMISGAEVNIRGNAQIEDLLQTLPQTVAANGDGNFGGNGVANVDLRGLTPVRTLVLVDGRRLPFGQSNSVAADLNQIPSQLVERVEVLTGGASAVYGADAVAGVVNFIMKRDFEGITIDGQLGINQTDNNSDRFETILNGGSQPVPGSQLDGFAWTNNVIIGANTAYGRGNVTASFSYRNANEIRQSDRIYAACAFGGGDPEFFCLGSSTTRPARIASFGLAPNQQFDLLAFDPNTGETRDFVSGGTPNDTFNFASTQRTRAPSERFTFNVFSHYDLTDNIELYLDLAFSNQRSQGQIGPSGNFFRTNRINCDNPFLNAAQLDAICTQNGLSGDDIATALVGRRNVEGGPRQFDFSNTTYRVSGGFRGDLGDNWTYDIFGQYARVINEQVRLNDLIIPRLQRSLLVSIDPETGDPACQATIAGIDEACVPWNIFQPGGITQEALDYISVPTFESGVVEQEILGATFTGDLGNYGITLPGADTGVQFVGGFEYRSDSLNRRADDFTQNGEVAGADGAFPPIQGTVSVYEFYGELAVPILEGADLAEELSATAAYRFSDYNTTGLANTWAVGLSWAPTSDIRFRGTFNRAVRAPNIFELFSPRNTGLFDLSDPDGDGIFDPCAGATPAATLEQCARTGVTAAQYGQIVDNPAGQFNQVIAGNPDLNVEGTKTYTLGAVFTPNFVDGLNLSVDYFNIIVDDFIGTVPSELALNNCLETGDEFFCSLVQRDAGGGLFVDQETSFVVATNINTGSIQTDGIDINLQYNFDVGNGFGNVNMHYFSTYLLSYETEPLPGEDTFECAGFYSGDCTIPRQEYSHTVRSTWQSERNVDVSLTWRHIGSVRQLNAAANSTNLNAELKAVNYFDLSASWGVADGVRMRAGINNLFDVIPPVSSAVPAGLGTGNTFPALYDVDGRFAFFGFTADF